MSAAGLNVKTIDAFAWETELNAILQILSRKEPRLLGITGRPVVGKTDLMQRVADAAAAEGWLVVAGEDRDCLCVDKSTTPESFCDKIAKQLSPEKYASSLDLPKETAPEADLPMRLRERAPALIVVDGFDSTPEFVDWLSGSFMAGMTAARSPVVVLYADIGADSALMERAGATVYALDRLEPERARSIIAAAAARIEPPLEEAELAAYVTEISNHPQLLSSLLQVLQLAEPTV